MQFSSLPINSSLQNNPRYKFSLKSENIEILPILSAAILKMAAIRSRFFFGQNILPTLLNIYAKFCGNPFGGFRYKWGQRFWHTLTVSMATRPFWNFQDLSAPLEMGIYLPVKFSKDRIISLWEFGRTSSQREEEEVE
jgi:hypothetical protein